MRHVVHKYLVIDEIAIQLHYKQAYRCFYPKQSLFLFGWVIADPAGNRFATGFKLVTENQNALFGVDPSDR